MACIGADFDNDGFVDILVDSSSDEYYHNDGDFTFTSVNNPFDRGALGDLNNDGFIDVWTGATLWMNDGNANNWSKIALTGVQSNLNGIGSRLEIYGDWGMQIRELRAGQDFRPMSTLDVMFGLGSDTEIDSLVIKWPSGIVDIFESPEINTRLEIIEGSGTPVLEEVSMTIQVMLEGPYNVGSGTMSDNLRLAGVIPTLEPFTALGYSHVGSGGETIGAGVLNATGLSAVVDWIWVEIRDGITPTEIIATKPCLVRSDGFIVDVNGNSNLAIDLPENGSFMVAIRHSNHLGFRNDVATANTPGTVHSFNMSDGSQTLYGSDPLNDIGGVLMMISGEANGDGQVNSVDKNNFWRVENGEIFEYSVNKADFNLDGAINALDKNFGWRPNTIETATIRLSLRR